jgi:hypothetical protein
LLNPELISVGSFFEQYLAMYIAIASLLQHGWLTMFPPFLMNSLDDARPVTRNLLVNQSPVFLCEAMILELNAPSIIEKISG